MQKWEGYACAKTSPSGKVASHSDDGEGFLAKADGLKAYTPTATVIWLK